MTEAKLDLERPRKVRRIFDAINVQGGEIRSPVIVSAVYDLTGDVEKAAQILDYLTGELNRGQKLDLWEKAGMIYDKFGA